MTKRYIDENECARLLRELVEQIHKARFQPDIIVVAPNGGLIPAGFIATQLKIKDTRLINVGRKDNKRFFYWPQDGNIGDITGKKILIIEDDIPTGKSVNLIKERLLSLGALKVRIACLFVITEIGNIADFFIEFVDEIPDYWWKKSNPFKNR